MKEDKKMKNKENMCHSFGEIITSPQPSPQGEGAVAGEVTNHTNTGEVTQKAAFSRLENPFARTCHFLCFRSRKFLSSPSERRFACSSAFSRLEKALRSNPLTALLRSRLSRFSPSERRFACSSAFSLAEVMVLLTVIAILMALAAPMITGPANSGDGNVIKKLDGNNSLIANGRFQQLVVGTNENYNDTKMEVKGRADFNRKIKFQNFVIDGNNLYIFRTADPEDDSISNATLKLAIDGVTGAANINLPLNSINLANNVSVTVPSVGYFEPTSNGYVYGAATINSTKETQVEGAATTIFNDMIGFTVNSGNPPDPLNFYPRLVPVSAGTKIECSPVVGNTCIFFPLETTTNTQNQLMPGYVPLDNVNHAP